MSSYNKIVTVKFAILFFYIITNFASVHGSGQGNGKDFDSNTIENVDIFYLKSHRILSTAGDENGTIANVEQITFSPSERMDINFEPDDSNNESVTVAPSSSPNFATKSSTPSVAIVPSNEPSIATVMISSSSPSMSLFQTGVPTPIVQKNAKTLNENDGKVDDNKKDKSSTSSVILYVVFSAVVAFGLVKIVQYRRRQILMREREMVMTSPSYNSGHLDELKYVDENEII
jgi:hypothetical protein